MLQRDVAEREIGRVGWQIEGATVGDLERAESVTLAEPTDRLVAPLEEPLVEVAGDDRAELAGERARHPADAGADLDEGLLLRVRAAQAERLEVGGHLVVTGCDELGEREFARRSRC